MKMGRWFAVTEGQGVQGENGNNDAKSTSFMDLAPLNSASATSSGSPVFWVLETSVGQAHCQEAESLKQTPLALLVRILMVVQVHYDPNK